MSRKLRLSQKNNFLTKKRVGNRTGERQILLFLKLWKMFDDKNSRKKTSYGNIYGIFSRQTIKKKLILLELEGFHLLTFWYN